MVIKCKITFEKNEKAAFFSGDEIKGTVKLEADEEKKIKGVILKIRGFAKTHWTESSGETTYYYGTTEKYLKKNTTLIGEQQNVITPGVHTFSFNCRIPPTCPSSYEGKHGHIRYIVKVVLIRPWTFNENFTRAFTVLSTVDLNAEASNIKAPSQRKVTKTLHSLPFKSEQLDLKVAIPQGGYVSGQKIPVTVFADNHSSVAVAETRLKLQMTVVNYNRPNKRKTKTENFIVSSLKCDAVPRNCKKIFNYLLPVRATPPTCNTRCGIIRINYNITLEAVVSGLHRNQKLFLPVIIGTIPLSKIMKTLPVAVNLPTQRELKEAESSASQVDTIPLSKLAVAVNVPTQRELKEAESNLIQLDEEGAVGYTSPEYEDMPPPTYEEALYMKPGKINADDEHDYGECEFAPSYPVFDTTSPTALTPEEMEKGFKE